MFRESVEGNKSQSLLLERQALEGEIVLLKNRNLQLEQEKKDLNFLNTSLNTKVSNLENTLEEDVKFKNSLEIKIKDLELQISSISQQLRDVIEKYNFEHNKRQQLEGIIQNSESEHINVIRERNTLVDEVQEAKNENLELIKTLEEKNNLFEKEKTSLLEKIGKLEEEIKSFGELKRFHQIQENKQIIQFTETKTEQKDIKNYYDCLIRVDSFCSLLLNQSWAIEFKNWENYRERVKERGARLAVLGYENVGKSWIISKLMGYEVPQGKYTKTSGICILYPTTSNTTWTALDTPGSNVSVKVESLKKKMDEYLKDKNLSEEDIVRMFYGDNILIETLLQEFIVNHAQLLLVVVGKLRRDDQRLISRIKSLPGKRILVIHNLLETKERSYAERIIQEDIKETFNATEKPFYLESKGLLKDSEGFPLYN